MTLKTVLIDDEYLALRILERYVSDYPSLLHVASFTDPRQGLEFINTNDVDLLLLDIQMPGLNGIDLVSAIRQNVMIAFTTARSDFAVKAFELNVLDYLVKPISPGRFKRVIDKALDMAEFMDAPRSNKSPGFIMIRADHRMHKVMLDEIIDIEGFSEYVKVSTKEGTLITLATLNSFADSLDSKRFIRIHKSYIVALSAIISVTARSATLVNKKTLPIGRTYKPAFREAALRFGLIPSP